VKLLTILGMALLVGAISLPFLAPLVSAGSFDFVLTGEDENVTHYNIEIPTNWIYMGERQVAVGSTHFVTPLGQLAGSLDDGVIHTVTHDGNLLLVINSINESSCELFAEIQGVTYPLSIAETKVLPVVVGDKFGVKFTQTSYGEHCSLQFDVNLSYVE